MKFTLTADALADAAAFASKGISARPPVPVLSGLLIEAQTGGLRISGFDYEKSARTQVAADVSEPGTVLLQGKMFTDIIRKFGRKTITVTVDERNATIQAGTAVFNMRPMQVDEFPAMPDLPPAAGAVDGDAFAAAVGQVIGAAATDDSVPMLMNVKLVTDGDTLIMRTTDRYRLAEVEIPWKSTGDNLDLIIPASWLQSTAKTMAGEASILCTDNIFGIRTGNRAATTIVIDGDYPKIGALFPASTPTTITVDRESLADVVGRVSLVAEIKTPVRITTADGTMTVEAGTGESAQGQETIPCDVDGPDIVVALNPGYLAWSLASTPSEVIHIGTQGPKPVLITGHEGLRQLLMPVRL